jgi:DNA ligase-1
MELPILFKRTKTGAVQQWQIVVIRSNFFTIEGQKDGVLTKSLPTVCEGKNIGRSNETSPTDQAEKEARARWQKKIESGYTEDLSEIDTAMKYFEPMLCAKYEDRKSKIKSTDILFSQPKLDGIRCVVKRDGMWSRNGKPIVSAPHIYKSLEPLFNKYDKELIFDGELYCDKFKNDFNSIVSLTRKTKPTEEDLKLSEESIQYWIYDFPFDNKAKFSMRFTELKSLMVLDGIPNSIVICPTDKVDSHKMLDELYYKYMADGFEGQIIRLDTPYENKRSNNILKRKQFMDEEFEIIDVVEGLGGRVGTVGALVCKIDSRTFRSNVKGTHKYLRKLWENKENLIGKMATVKFFEYTPDKIPRFPFCIKIDRMAYE